MLVTTVTTAVCFYSNVASVMLVVREFGVFMGTVVLLNYFHVMTILPSAILVSDLHLVPWWRRLRERCSCVRSMFPCRSGKNSGCSSGVFGCNQLGSSSETDAQKASNSTGEPDYDNNDAATVTDTLPAATASVSSFSGHIEVADPVVQHSQEQDGTDAPKSTSIDIGSMNRVDRWLYSRYAPFIYKWRWVVIFVSMALTTTLGTLAFKSFAVSEQSLVIFKVRWNLGRITMIHDKFLKEFSTFLTEDGALGSYELLLEEKKSEILNTAPSSAQPVALSALPTSLPTSVPTITTSLVPTSVPTSRPTIMGHSTENIDSTLASPLICPQCLNGGVCNNSSKTCDCIVGFSGSACEFPTCPASMIDSEWKLCSGFGQCREINENDVNEGTFCLCDEGYTGIDCSTEISSLLQLKEVFEVKLVWGVGKRSNVFAGILNKNSYSYYSLSIKQKAIDFHDIPFQNSFDLSDPKVQMWLLETAKAVRDTRNMHFLPGTKTWIELLEEEVTKNNVSFPLQRSGFAGTLSLMMENPDFRRLFSEDIGTYGPGFSGKFAFASLTFLQVARGSREASLKRWENFVRRLNMDAPTKAGGAIVHSDAFTEVYRKEAILSTTISTWAIANGFVLLIILFFSQNISLSLIVMFTIILLIICLMGFVLVILSIEFGSIEAIGVTIFIGLSANYALHVVHAYHNALTRDRMKKVQLAIFATGSPIMAAAISTVGACAFLLGCRLWLLVELGMMLCSNTAMALIFSMVFLVALLSVIGPLPYEDNSHLHQCDFRTILGRVCCHRRRTTGSIDNNDGGDGSSLGMAIEDAFEDENTLSKLDRVSEGDFDDCSSQEKSEGTFTKDTIKDNEFSVPT